VQWLDTGELTALMKQAGADIERVAQALGRGK